MPLVTRRSSLWSHLGDALGHTYVMYLVTPESWDGREGLLYFFINVLAVLC